MLAAPASAFTHSVTTVSFQSSSEKGYDTPGTLPETLTDVPKSPKVNIVTLETSGSNSLQILPPVQNRTKNLTGRMSFGQERFWFLNEYLEDKTTFGIVAMLKLSGTLDMA